MADLERDKNEVEIMISKKDQDDSNAHKMLEDNQSIAMKLQKTLKELQQSIEMSRPGGAQQEKGSGDW